MGSSRKTKKDNVMIYLTTTLCVFLATTAHGLSHKPTGAAEAPAAPPGGQLTGLNPAGEGLSSESYARTPAVSIPEIEFRVTGSRLRSKKEWSWKLKEQKSFHQKDIDLDYPANPKTGIFRIKVTRHYRYTNPLNWCPGNDHEVHPGIYALQMYDAGDQPEDYPNQCKIPLSAIQKDDGIMTWGNDSDEVFQTRRMEIVPFKRKAKRYRVSSKYNRYFEQSGNHKFIINFKANPNPQAPPDHRLIQLVQGVPMIIPSMDVPVMMFNPWAQSRPQTNVNVNVQTGAGHSHSEVHQA